MRPRRAVQAIVVTLAVAGGLWYLYDPPWVATTTRGLREMERDEEGNAFRWTGGSATFYVPTTANVMTLRLRAWYPPEPGRQVIVSVAVDDRPITSVHLDEARHWYESEVALAGAGTRRRSRRVDLYVNRAVGQEFRGVELGEITLR